MNRTRAAFELKLQKANKTTDLRIPASVCTMFNVLVDAKKQSTKLCALDGGQEVSGLSVTCGNVARVPWQRTTLPPKFIHLIRLKRPSSSMQIFGDFFTLIWNALYPLLLSASFLHEDCLPFYK